MGPFTYSTQIRLAHTDAAGIVFFTNYLSLAHECYEVFLDGFSPLGHILEEGKLHLPIAHAECDFRSSLKVSDQVSISLSLKEIRRCSFTLAFEFVKATGVAAALALTRHVVVNPDTGKPMSIPPDLKNYLLTVSETA